MLESVKVCVSVSESAGVLAIVYESLCKSVLKSVLVFGCVTVCECWRLCKCVLESVLDCVSVLAHL